MVILYTQAAVVYYKGLIVLSLILYKKKQYKKWKSMREKGKS